jgi:prepilin-type N-terminal cleavage/methylation domain-containing protein
MVQAELNTKLEKKQLKKQVNKQKGFTLIEIAIVMVIIGLLLGGVLKGQEIIQNAKLKNAINQYNGIIAAAYSYQDRYASLPGDDANASARFGLGSNGDGNGTISGNFDTTTAGAESRLFFQHLRAAGLIKGAATDEAQPIHPWGNIIGVEDNIHGLDGLVVCYAGLEGDTAEILDRQNDDGIPNAGTVQGHATQTSYVSTSQYDVCFRF